MDTGIYPSVNQQPLLADESGKRRDDGKQQPVNLGWFRWFQVIASALIITLLIVLVAHVNTILNHVDNDNNDVMSTLSSLSAASARSARPLNFVVPAIPPRTYQYTRGTCWDFGTIGAVEHQYRLQGQAAGWLNATQYVRFSEQAYGNQILSLCQQHQERCLLPGDRVAFNSTEGGEAILLFSFKNELANRLLPDSVCPYIQNSDNSSCPGIETALQQNPITFSLKAFSTLYSVDSIKNALLSKRYSMPLSMAIHTVSYYMPCTDPLVAETADCTSPQLYMPCPTDASFAGATRCVKHSAPMYNMNAEFRVHHALDPEAGHVVLLVGYSDTYVTKDGLKGGFIVRNSWKDGLYSFDEFKHLISRGSHSTLYFTQQISEADERALCPNVFDPRNWYACGAGETLTDMMNDCLSVDNQRTAKASIQPLNLVCNSLAAGATLCDSAPSIRYYTLNMTAYGDDFTLACFLRVDTNAKTASDFCLAPMLIDEISTIFMPAPSDTVLNDDDYCGFYFYPYQVWEADKETFASGFVNDYELSFTPASYTVNAADAATGKSFSLLKSSTWNQRPLPTIANTYPVPPMN